MRKLHPGQQVIYESILSGMKLKGRVELVEQAGVWIKFDHVECQKSVRTDTELSSAESRVKSGVQKGNVRFFPWAEYEKHFSEGEENSAV